MRWVRLLRRGRTLDQALTAAPGLDALSPRDVAFARLLLLTTLRRLGQIDAFLAGLMDHPLPARRGPVQDVLRLGIAQLAFLETPCPRGGGEHRRARTRASAHALPGTCQRSAASGLPRTPRDRRTRRGPRLNTPDWLWRSWAQAYGDARCRAIAEAHLKEPPLDLSPLTDTEERAEALCTALAAERLPRRHAATARRRRGDAAGWLRGG